MGKHTASHRRRSFGQILSAFIENSVGKTTCRPSACVDHEERMEGLYKSQQTKAERQWYLERADQVLQTPMKSVKDINVSQVKNLKNEMQINSYLTRESRRIIDAEEGNTEALIRAWLLTQDTKYADEAIKRVFIMADWDKDKNVKGDFNASSLLSLCSMAYDSFYDRLNTSQKKALLEAIKIKVVKCMRTLITGWRTTSPTIMCGR